MARSSHPASQASAMNLQDGIKSFVLLKWETKSMKIFDYRNFELKRLNRLSTSKERSRTANSESTPKLAKTRSTRLSSSTGNAPDRATCGCRSHDFKPCASLYKSSMTRTSLELRILTNHFGNHPAGSTCRKHTSIHTVRAEVFTARNKIAYFYKSFKCLKRRSHLPRGVNSIFLRIVCLARRSHLPN